MTKHIIEEKPDGFIVRCPGKNPVEVRAHATGLDVEYLTRCNTSSASSKSPVSGRTFGWYQYYTFSHAIAQGLMYFWQRPANHPHPPWPGLDRWVIQRTAGAIGKSVFVQWQRLIDGADPRILSVQRSAFSATLSCSHMILNRDLYDHKYIVRDITRYRAAAIAAVNIENLARLAKRNAHLTTTDIVQLNQQIAALKNMAIELNVDLRVSAVEKGLPKIDEPNMAEQLDFLRNWLALFSPTNASYRSLNRTLMNLPGGIPHRLVCYLSYVQLERPITKRLELLTLLFAVEGSRVQRHRDIFMQASESLIRRAMKIVGRSTNNCLNTRRARDVKAMVLFLLDYPYPHNGNIVGLAEKSVQWHRDEQRQITNKTLEQFGETRPTTKPPVPLPKHQDITFINSVGDLVEEGTRMDHCLASYAESAVNGRSYFFHVVYSGEHATIQVDSSGQVVQAHGPRNKRNTAVRWGKKIISKWASGLPSTPDELPF